MMNLNITLIKKFNFDILALYLFFLMKVSPGIYADGFNYDDSHEILITRVDSVYDFFAFADHHFLYSLILYLISFFIPFVNLQIINLLFVFIILFLTKKLYQVLSLSYLSFLFSVIILISSPIFSEYALRIKQYTLDYLLVLLLIFIFVKFDRSEITTQQFLLFGVLVSSLSFILVPIFLTTIFFNFRKNFRLDNLKILILVGILAYIFFGIGVVRLKFLDEKFIEYFSFSFLINGSLIEELSNLFFALLIFFRGVSDNGFLFLFLSIFTVGLFKSYKRNKKIVEIFALLLAIFCLLHLFDIYPISGGRNMTFIYPFVILFSSQIADISKNKRISMIILFVASILLTSSTQVSYPNSYIAEFVNELSDRELIIVDYYLIPQYSLYSENTYTKIQRRNTETDKCLYSSNKENIIFLNDDKCNQKALELNANLNYNSYKRIIFLSEENKINTKGEVNRIFKNLQFSLVSETKLGKTYKLIYEK